MFKFVSNFFGYLFLLCLLISPLFLLVGAFLIWKGHGTVRVLGWLFILLVAYYRLHWISPWYVTQGCEVVQEFKLDFNPFGSSPSVRWMDTPPSLLFVPDERVRFHPAPPEYNHVLVVDIKARRSNWQPRAEVNLATTKKIESLPTTPLDLGTRSEFSYVGFSLPILFYKLPFFSDASGWKWEKTYFGWAREVVRESESDSVLVELNQIVFNAPSKLAGFTSRLVMEGKFIILEPNKFIDPQFTEHRILILGPFNTSQNT